MPWSWGWWTSWGLREAVLAGELAGISGEPEVVSIGQPPSFLEILLSALGGNLPRH